VQSPQHRRPIVLGLAAAWLAPVLVLAVQDGELPDPRFLQSTAFEVWAKTSALVVLLVGTPLVLLLKRFGWLTWLGVIGSSVVVSNFLAQWFVASMLGSLAPDRLFDPRILLNASLLGLAAGAAFCLAAWPNNSFKVTR
jgi:hypothetical protein